MKSRLARLGALALAIGMLGVVVVHGGLAGCRGPENVAPSAEPASAQAPVRAPAASGAPAALGSSIAEAAGSTSPSVQAPHPSAAARPAAKTPRFMGASKAAPVFNEDDVKPAPNPPSQLP